MNPTVTDATQASQTAASTERADAPTATDSRILAYHEAFDAGPTAAGGKGWNLGRLSRYGFPVPIGGVLHAEAYREHLQAAGVEAELVALTDVPATSADSPEVTARLAAIRAAIVATALPVAIVEAIRTFLAQHGLVDTPLAVRSSATAEDGAEASFAGIHESTLNVLGFDAVLDAVRACYASLWSPRAFAYRRRLGLADPDVACAVVLCAMVGRAGTTGQPPVAAGVAFSADPRTGRRDRIVVNAAPGLGEALVGGLVDPEEIEVAADMRGLRVVARRGSAGTVLTDAQILALSELAMRVHWALGEGQDPLDIEWAYDGSQFWLVQARPVTRLPRVTAEPVRHLPVVWSNANLKDAVAGVPSSLGYSVLQPILRSSLYTYLQELGYAIPPGMETVRRIDGRVYFDLTTMQWLSYDAIGVLPAEMNLSLGGMQPEIPVPPKPFAGQVGRRRNWDRLRLLKLLWQSARIYDREIARVRALVKAQVQEDISGLTNAEIVAWRGRGNDLAMEFMRLFQINNVGSFWDKVLMDTIEKLRPGSGTRVTSGLLAGSNAVVTAEHGYRLIDLAQIAESEPAARANLETQPLDPWGWRTLPSTSPFRRAFEAFLDEFGHRGVYEVEIANPRWIEDPSWLLEQIRAFIGQHGTMRGRQDAVRRRAAAEREVRTLPFWSRPLVNWLAHRARRAAALREAGKSAIVSTMLVTRVMTRELGARMVATGVLDDPQDIYHLTTWDIAAWALSTWDSRGARALVADRAARQAAWLAQDAPDVIVLDAGHRPTELPASMTGTDGPASEVLAPSSVERIDRLEGKLLRGAGVSSGRVRGTARLIRHPDESARLQVGDVLVAPSTDPGWTPLFLRASAVVMEVGGYLSHGAIVAREYGLPAVVNVPGALATIQDGQLLEVDGDTGEVIAAPACSSNL